MKTGIRLWKLKGRFFVLASQLILVMVILTTSSFSESQQSQGRESRESAEEIQILITAEQVEFDPQQEIAIYRGNVTVKEKNTTLFADRLEVYLQKEGKEIDLIKAYGHIKLVQEDKIVTAEEGVYYHREKKVVLTGKASSQQGRNMMRGDRIVYFLDDGKVLVEGNVEATIHVDKGKEGQLRQE